MEMSSERHLDIVYSPYWLLLVMKNESAAQGSGDEHTEQSFH